MSKLNRPNAAPKFISKKMKYGQLQKLKWYCEICQHQCNDEKAFRQHVQSEKHRIMMAHFRENSTSIIRTNSHLFETNFVDILKNRYPNKEILANVVYGQVISDKHHVHMNSTRWESVRGFCSYLEQKGIVKMRMTERGPYLTYIAKSTNQLISETNAQLIEQQRELDKKREQELLVKAHEAVTSNIRAAPKPLEARELESVITQEQKGPEKKVASLFGKSSRPKPPPPMPT